jgi:hypothetical protein
MFYTYFMHDREQRYVKIPKKLAALENFNNDIDIDWLREGGR